MTRYTMGWLGENSRSRAVFSIRLHCSGVTRMFFWMVCGIGFIASLNVLRGVVWARILPVFQLGIFRNPRDRCLQVFGLSVSTNTSLRAPACTIPL